MDERTLHRAQGTAAIVTALRAGLARSSPGALLDTEAALEHVRGAVAMFRFGEDNRAFGKTFARKARQRWTKRAERAGEPVPTFGRAGRPPGSDGSEAERLTYLLMFIWRHHTGSEPASTPRAPFVTFVRAVAPFAGLEDPSRDSLARDVKRIKRRVARARRDGTKVADILDILGWLQAPSGWKDGPLPPWWPEYMDAMEGRFEESGRRMEAARE